MSALCIMTRTQIHVYTRARAHTHTHTHTHTQDLPRCVPAGESACVEFLWLIVALRCTKELCNWLSAMIEWHLTGAKYASNCAMLAQAVEDMVRSVGGLEILADDLRRVAAARQAAASVVSIHLVADSIDSTYCDAVDEKSSTCTGGHCRCVSGCIQTQFQSDGARPDVNKALPVLPHHLQEVRLTEMTIAVMQLLCECFDDVDAHAFRAKTRCCDGFDGGEDAVVTGGAVDVMMMMFITRCTHTHTHTFITRCPPFITRCPPQECCAARMCW